VISLSADGQDAMRLAIAARMASAFVELA